MDRTGVSNKRGKCQLSFVYLGERYRPVLSGLSYANPADRKAAARMLAAVRREIELGTFYFPKHFPAHKDAARFRKGHQITVADALTDWLKSRRPRVEPTTYYGYEKSALGHLIPALGKYRLSELRTSDVEDWLEGLDISGKTKNNVLIPLRSVFKLAIRDDKIERDPIAKIAHFSHRAKQPDPLTRPEMEAVLHACAGQVQNIIEFAFWTGLRTSELIAIRWQDVDLAAGLVRIRVTRTSHGEKNYGKTATSVRDVELFPPARAALARQEAFTAGKPSVFENPRTCEPWKSDNPYRKWAWIPALARAGVRYRPAYQSRHTYASMLLSAGANPMYVAQQMGHKDWGMIRKVYGRWLPDHSEGEREKIASLWAPQRRQNHG